MSALIPRSVELVEDILVPQDEPHVDQQRYAPCSSATPVLVIEHAEPAPPIENIAPAPAAPNSLPNQSITSGDPAMFHR